VSLRERLQAAQRPSIVHTLAVADTTDVQAALKEAQTRERMAILTDGEDSTSAELAARAVQVAEAAFDECVERIRFTAIPAGDFEALVAAHPPAKGSDDDWNPDTFRPALLESCAEGDMTAEDWSAWLKQASVGDRDELWLACLQVNLRSPELTTIPKGWTATRT
jgi:hypothetical protein